MTRYSRSTACAEGSSLPGGLRRMTYFLRGRDELVGRVGLAALELADGERALVALDIRFHPRGEFRLVELVAVGDVLGAAEEVGGVGVRHVLPLRRSSGLGPNDTDYSNPRKFLACLSRPFREQTVEGGASAHVESIRRRWSDGLGHPRC